MNILEKRINDSSRLKWQRWHIDPPLFIALVSLAIIGLFILYSASNENTTLLIKQGLRLVIAFTVMLVFSHISPKRIYAWTPIIFIATVLLLVAVLAFGQVDQGARRWLNLGFIHFQPSEIMKIAMPMMISFYLANKELPPRIKILFVSAIILVIPVLLIIKQPDLGTAILIASSGVFVLILAGMNWRLILSLLTICVASTPLLWHFMHQYQRNRVLTFLNPERDPLGSGYHIIQSKIAIGSGGLFGKGWLQGTQSHLHFLPAHATDFIFAVSGEELGLIGNLVIIGLFLFILGRCFYMSMQAQDNFTRLLSGSLSMTFIFSAFINIGMVIGILPVVGVPLPLISYGGSSMVVMMAGFGMITAIHTHRKIWTS